MINTGRGIPYTGKVVAMRPTSTMLLQLVEAGYTGAQHAWPDVLPRLADLRYEEAAELLRWHRRTGDWLALVNGRRAAAIAQGQGADGHGPSGSTKPVEKSLKCDNGSNGQEEAETCQR